MMKVLVKFGPGSERPPTLLTTPMRSEGGVWGLSCRAARNLPPRSMDRFYSISIHTARTDADAAIRLWTIFTLL